MRRHFLTLIILALPFVAKSQNLAISTNIVDYASYGTMNLTSDYGFARQWSVVADARYNPFSWKGDGPHEVRAKQRSGAVGVRFWPWHIYSGWWMACKAQYQEYSTTLLRSDSSSWEGDRAGGSLSAGYSYMLSPHFNLNVGLGVWAGVDKYVVYECPRCGRTVDSGTKTFLLPNDIQLSVSYVF